MLAALDRTIASLTKDHGADPAGWRDVHPRSTIDSLTGVIGPSRTMPYQDRGSWVQVIDFAPVARPVVRPVTPAGQLPATGGPALPAIAALLLLITAAALRRTKESRA
jgi:hypothetical protein